MIPKKLERYNPTTKKQYEHVYTKEEQQKILFANLEGKNPRSVIQEIVASLNDDDWVEVNERK